MMLEPTLPENNTKEQGGRTRSPSQLASDTNYKQPRVDKWPQRASTDAILHRLPNERYTNVREQRSELRQFVWRAVVNVKLGVQLIHLVMSSTDQSHNDINSDVTSEYLRIYDSSSSSILQPVVCWELAHHITATDTHRDHSIFHDHTLRLLYPFGLIQTNSKISLQISTHLETYG